MSVGGFWGSLWSGFLTAQSAPTHTKHTRTQKVSLTQTPHTPPNTTRPQTRPFAYCFVYCFVSAAVRRRVVDCKSTEAPALSLSLSGSPGAAGIGAVRGFGAFLSRLAFSVCGVLGGAYAGLPTRRRRRRDVMDDMWWSRMQTLWLEETLIPFFCVVLCVALASRMLCAVCLLLGFKMAMVRYIHTTLSLSRSVHCALLSGAMRMRESERE